jgi:ribosomal protein S18 acetylase RimI-like enzyme
MLIRDHLDGDVPAVIRCIVALQDFERRLDPRLRPGEAMAAAYWDGILQRCREVQGRVLVADLDGVVAGFGVVLTRVPFTELDDPQGEYALVSDLVVLPEHRRRGIGGLLMQRAETVARDAGATCLRIGVLAANKSARDLYAAAGFEPYLEVLEKRLSSQTGPTPARAPVA